MTLNNIITTLTALATPQQEGHMYRSPEVLLKPLSDHLFTVVEVRVVEHLTSRELGDTSYTKQRH